MAVRFLELPENERVRLLVQRLWCFGAEHPTCLMIRSVVVPLMLQDSQHFSLLQTLFSRLGFADGDSWSDDRSRGAPFLAPIGAIEVIHGDAPAQCDLLMEVKHLDTVLAIVEELGILLQTAPYDTHWNSRLAVAKLPTGLRVGFFEFKDAAKRAA